MKFPKLRIPLGGKGRKDSANTGSDELKRKDPLTVTKESDGVIKIGKTNYAVSLSRTLNREGMSIKDQSLDMPKVVGATAFDLYMRPSAGRITFGASSLGHKKGHIPLAESLDTNILGDNWIVAFRVDKRYWWFSTSVNGTIGDDILVKEEIEIRDLVYSGVNNLPTAKIYASPALNFPGSEQAEIWDLINRKPAALRKIGFIRNNRSRIIVLLVTSVSVFGMWTFYQSRLEAMRQQEIAMQEAAARRVTVMKEDFPWFSGYRMDDFVMNCVGAFDKAHMRVIGWEAKPLTCSFDRQSKKIFINAGYDRTEYGRIADLRSAYEGTIGDLVLNNDGQGAVYTQTFDVPLTPGYFEHDPWASPTIHETLMERFQNLNVEVSLTRPEIPNVNIATIDKPVFFNHSVGIVTTGIPFEEVGLVGDVPAIVPGSIVWNPTTDQWGVTFEVYHPPILPANVTGNLATGG